MAGLNSSKKLIERDDEETQKGPKYSNIIKRKDVQNYDFNQMQWIYMSNVH